MAKKPYITLGKMLRMLDVYQNFQLINSRSGECYTGVTYLAGCSPDASETINLHMEDLVHGISAGVVKWNEDGRQEIDCTPYLIISLDSTI